MDYDEIFYDEDLFHLHLYEKHIWRISIWPCLHVKWQRLRNSDFQMSFHVIAVLSLKKKKHVLRLCLLVFCSLLELAWMCLKAGQSWTPGDSEWRRRLARSCLTKLTRRSWRWTACRRGCGATATWRWLNRVFGSFSAEDVSVYEQRPYDCQWCQKWWIKILKC